MANTKKVSIELWEPHTGQQYIQDNAKRFNVVPCSRRFGKTETIYAIYDCLILPAVESGWCIGIFTPKLKDFLRQWNNIKKIYEGLIKKADNTQKVLYFHGGGELWLFSLANDGEKDNGRGWPFHRVIYEETQKIPDAVFDHNWKEAIRPALSDYKGDAYFIGTANGTNNQWHEFAKRGARNGDCATNSDGQIDLPMYEEGRFVDWITFRMTTSTNPHIPQEEIDAALDDMDLQSWKQEYFSHFIDYTGQAWAYSLEDADVRQKVVRKLEKINWGLPVYITFDFNKVPMTAAIMQKKQLTQTQKINSRFKYSPQFKKSFKLGHKKKGRKEELQQTIFNICEQIRMFIYEETGQRVGKWTYKNARGEEVVERFRNRFKIEVSGDASGNVSSGMIKDPITYYSIIEDELGISAGSIYVPKKNPYLADSWAESNVLLQKCPEFGIDEDGCKELISDLAAAKDDGKHGIKKASGEQESHLVDCFRYAINSFCKDIRI